MDQNRNSSHDSAIGWIILAVLGICLFWLFWYFFEFQVKSGYRWMRWGEMLVISRFLTKDYAVNWNGAPVNYRDLMDYVASLPATKLGPQTLSALSYVSMYPLRLPFTIVMALMGIWAMMWGPGTQYRRKMNLGGLIAVQAKNFPIIAPFVKFNPADQPPRPPGAPVPAELPAFAEALAPEEWVAYNQIPAPDGHIDEQAAFVAFSRQLGPRWQGWTKMAPHKQVLLACFCLKAARKRADSDDLLGRLAKCWSHEHGLQLKKDAKLRKDAMRVLRTKSIAASVLEKCNQHGFETTALIRGLATAREEGGVLAPAQFVWLRAFDRTLWYPLNNLGRQSFHMEAVGAMAHYKAEKLTRRPIPRPKVQEAVRSIIGYIRSPRARPIPPLDYSKSKNKSGVKKPVKKQAKK